uniref:Nudix hydrolase domain-containing protein n=1 Tax=Fibrocapsa japonica TaxID=94617 RepID=A0A7S2XVB5_9STRA|mmetsp:Transcript_12328/g.18175  ORF Transcript_12328/g.18175 Transcript_12328/m.18175 type:complete len:412 (+) Transcript_12328:52-1287(+)
MATFPILRNPNDAFPDSWNKSICILCTSSKQEKDALDALEQKGFENGVIFVPPKDNRDEEWEEKVFQFSDLILFWFDTSEDEKNLAEFGRWAATGKALCGKADAFQSSKIEKLAKEGKLTVSTSMADLIAQVDKKLAKCTQPRELGERQVPAHVWLTPSFQLWVKSVKEVGNRLDAAKLEYSFRVGPGGVFTLYWVIHADVHVTAENRNKSNEIVIGRPDVSMIFAYRTNGPHLMDTDVVLIKEFRSPCRGGDGFVHELPGGSSFKFDPATAPEDAMLGTAAEELEEEAGVKVEGSRMTYHGSKQIASTVCAHHAHLFSVELSEAEMNKIKDDASKKVALGVIEETERTYPEVHKLRDLMKSQLIDFAAIGMINSVLAARFAGGDKAQSANVSSESAPDLWTGLGLQCVIA